MDDTHPPSYLLSNERGENLPSVPSLAALPSSGWTMDVAVPTFEKCLQGVRKRSKVGNERDGRPQVLVYCRERKDDGTGCMSGAPEWQPPWLYVWDDVASQVAETVV